MVSASVTIADMGRKKKQGRTPSYTLFARIRTDVGDAFERYLDSLPVRPTSTRAIETILEGFLRDKGFLASEDRAAPPAS